MLIIPDIFWLYIKVVRGSDDPAVTTSSSSSSRPSDSDAHTKPQKNSAMHEARWTFVAWPFIYYIHVFCKCCLFKCHLPLTTNLLGNVANIPAKIRNYLKNNEGSNFKDANAAWMESTERATILGGREGFQMWSRNDLIVVEFGFSPKSRGVPCVTTHMCEWWGRKTMTTWMEKIQCKLSKLRAYEIIVVEVSRFRSCFFWRFSLNVCVCVCVCDFLVP